MTPEDKAIIQDYLNIDEPFGPVDAREIESQRAIELLFEKHNELYKHLHQRPSIVVGRKGSGKTSYLNSVYFANGYKYIVELDAAELFSNVIKSISKISYGPVFAESVSKVWESVLYIGLFSSLRKQLPASSRSKKLINDYLAKIGMRDDCTVEDAVWKVTEIISEKAEKKSYGIIAEILRSLDNVTFNSTRASLVSELRENRQQVAVLLDSLDDFMLEFESVGRSLQGLLMFVGGSNKPSSPIDIRLCLPAELYHRFLDISSNPNKDFRRKLLLHWVAPELVFIAAHRIGLYCESFDLSFPLKSISGIATKRGAQSAVRRMLPDEITCGLGIIEPTLSYILRHTQLLPRHLIIILNSIAQKSKILSGSDTLTFNEEAVRKGISDVEEVIVQEIFVAYRPVYPYAQSVCEKCIPEISNEFSIGDLERVFRRHGKAAMGSDDIDDFKRMLIEIGCIGRVIEETERYIQGEFEYTIPHKLITGTDDMLCIHPLFAGVFSAKIRKRKPVYPFGSQVEDKDYRQH